MNEWVERVRDWDEHVTRMDVDRLVKIPRDHNVPVRGTFLGCPKRKWSDLLLY